MPISGTITSAPSGGAPSAPAPVRFAGTNAPPTEPVQAAPPAAPAPAGAPPAPPEGTPEGKEPQIESWRIAAIAKKEAAARRAQESARADREAATKAYQDAQNARDALQKEIQLIKTDPAQFMKVFGASYYNELSKFIADGGYTPEAVQAQAVQTAQEKLAAAEARIAEVEKKSEARAQQIEAKIEEERKAQATAAEESAVEEFRGEIQSFLQAEAVPFKLVAKSPGGVDAIYRVIDQHYTTTGQTLGFKEAAEVVQGKFIQEAQEFLSDPDVVKLIFPNGLPYGGRPAPKPAAPTLSNRMQPTPQAAPQRAPETEQERRARVTSEIEAAWRARRGG